MQATKLTTLLFLIGASIGATGAWHVTRDDRSAQEAGSSAADSIASAAAGDSARGGTAVAGDALRPLGSGVAGAGGPAAGESLDALADLASRDPAEAFARAQALEADALRVLALERVAREWAVIDADAALDALATLTDQALRRAFGGALFTKLASMDPEATLARITEADFDAALLARDSIAIIAAEHPDAVMSAINRATDRNLRDLLANALVRGVAVTDPIAATRIADTLPPSIAKRQIYYEIGRQFAGRDPDGAIAWALALEDGSSAPLMSTIFGTIAANDLGRAVDLSLSDAGSQFELDGLFFVSSSSIGYKIVSDTVVRNLDQMPEIVERLVNSDNPRATSALPRALESWALADPDSAMNWLRAHSADAAPAHVAALAAGFSHGDVRMTAAAVDLLPPATRGNWIAEVAAVYAAEDAGQALDWLSRYRGDPAYDAWVSMAAQRTAANSTFEFDPAPAASLLLSADKPDPAAVRQIVQSWARQEPEAAGDWALSLRDPSARAAGVAAAVQGWANGDIASASRWALELAPGSARDAALGPIVSRSLASGAVDSRIVAAFSSDASREAALIEALPGLTALARRDAARARGVVDAYYTTPALRQRAQAVLDGVPVQR